MHLTAFLCEVDEYSVWLLRHWYRDNVILHKGSMDKRIERFRDVIYTVRLARERITMAKKSTSVSSSSSKANSGFKPVSWVNCNLTDEHIEQIENWELSDTELLTAMSALVGEGYALSVKKSPDGQSVMATIVGNSSDCENTGRGMSAFASTPDDAFKVLLFKHYDILGGKWGEGTSNGAKYR